MTIQEDTHYDRPLDVEGEPVGRSDSAASFTYSDMELNRTVNRCSSGEEFEFPLLVSATTDDGTGIISSLRLQHLCACHNTYDHAIESGKSTATNGVAKTVETTAQKVQQMETSRALDEALQHLDDHHLEQIRGMYIIVCCH